jgi:hypothetical protein
MQTVDIPRPPPARDISLLLYVQLSHPQSRRPLPLNQSLLLASSKEKGVG